MHTIGQIGFFPMLLSSLPAVYSRWFFAIAPLPALSSRWIFAIAPRPADAQQRRPGWSALPQRPYQQLRLSASAGQLLRCNTSVSTSAVAPWPVNFSAAALRPATNLIRRRSTPVWLAIWRIWAGFANSQHRDAAFATPDNICAHSSLLQH